MRQHAEWGWLDHRTTVLDRSSAAYAARRFDLGTLHLRTAAAAADAVQSSRKDATRMPSQPDLTTIGGQIRAARLAAGMSQSDLEAVSGIPKPRLSRYENNHIMPSLHSLALICNAMGVRPGQIVDAVFRTQ
jgi:DNA-binding transcriptional regulator YiaG